MHTDLAEREIAYKCHECCFLSKGEEFGSQEKTLGRVLCKLSHFCRRQQITAP